MTRQTFDLAAQRRTGARLTPALTWVLVPVIAVAAAVCGGSPAAMGGAAAAAAVLSSLLPGAGQLKLPRALSGVILMIQVSLLVAAFSGRAWEIDMHMAYFAALAALVIYCDWIVIVAAAGAVAIHHLTLSYLLPSAVFPNEASLGRVTAHAVILIIEAAILIFVSFSINRMFELNAAARREADAAARETLSAQAERERQRAVADEERERADHLSRQTEADQAELVDTLAEALARLSEGDLTVEIARPRQPRFAKIASDFNIAIGGIRSAISQVRDASSGINSEADQISHSADELARRTEQQAAGLAETAAALDQITATVARSARGARQADEAVRSVRAVADRSGAVVGRAMDAMGAIEESSDRIARILGVIDQIAFQTNLLAINAGVEAARAGDAGKGFAVVAQEVRALAQRSSDAAKEINALIRESSTHVQQGVGLVGDAGAALTQIADKVAEVNGLVSEISASAEAQSTALNQVNTAMNQMDQGTQHNAAMVEETSAAIHALRSETAALDQLISRFRLGSGSAGLHERAHAA